MAACPAGKGCKATARLARVNSVECAREPREERMESWMAFEPPKVSLTTQMSPDLGHGPSEHHLAIANPPVPIGKSLLKFPATDCKH